VRPSTEKSITNPFKEAIDRSTAKDMALLRANSFNQKVRTIVMKNELIQTDSFKEMPKQDLPRPKLPVVIPKLRMPGSNIKEAPK
jgi:hypothetical protein